MELRHRRQFLQLAAGALSLPATSRIGQAQGYPSRPVRIIVPFPAGNATDIVARLIGQRLSDRLGQSFVVENRTGAGGNIAADYVAQAEPDGLTLMVSPPGPLAINQSLYRQLSYNPEDFVPITVLASGTNLVVVRPELGVGSVLEMIASPRESPACSPTALRAMVRPLISPATCS